MTEPDELPTKPDGIADLASADALADRLARVDAARGRSPVIAQALEQDRQNATALTPIWMRLIALLESAPPLPHSDAEAVTLSKAVADELRGAACPIGQIGSLSTEA